MLTSSDSKTRWSSWQSWGNDSTRGTISAIPRGQMFNGWLSWLGFAYWAHALWKFRDCVCLPLCSGGSTFRVWPKRFFTRSDRRNDCLENTRGLSMATSDDFGEEKREKTGGPCPQLPSNRKGPAPSPRFLLAGWRHPISFGPHKRFAGKRPPFPSIIRIFTCYTPSFHIIASTNSFWSFPRSFESSTLWSRHRFSWWNPWKCLPCIFLIR